MDRGYVASTIDAIYKSRWQIKLFFKALEQNLKIKTFVSTTYRRTANHHGLWLIWKAFREHQEQAGGRYFKMTFQRPRRPIISGLLVQERFILDSSVFVLLSCYMGTVLEKCVSDDSGGLKPQCSLLQCGSDGIFCRAKNRGENNPLSIMSPLLYH